MYIKVRVIAKAKKEGVEEPSPGHFVVRVRKEAERNLANARMLELIALHFGIAPKKVRIISGHHHPIKLLSVDMGEKE